MFSRLLRFIAPPPLANTGSLARDLLASERTFLAWTRTGLTFIALGVALEKVEAFAALSPTMLHLSDSRTKLAAGILVAAGSLTVGHGTVRYYGALKLLQEGKFRPNTGGVALLAATSVGMALAGAVMVMENEAEKEQIEIEGVAVKDGREERKKAKAGV